MKTFLGYVQRHGFALFAWWRVIVGSLGLIALALGEVSRFAMSADLSRATPARAILNWPVLRKRQR